MTTFVIVRKGPVMPILHEWATVKDIPHSIIATSQDFDYHHNNYDAIQLYIL